MSFERIAEFPRLNRLGDSCVSVQLAAPIDPEVNARCIALAASLERLAFRGVRDIVPTCNAVTIHFDPLVADGETLGMELRRIADEAPQSSAAESRTIEIPVSYGGASGPDLGAVAEFAKCSEADVVRLHLQTQYRVYMLGFLPGFAYMGTVDPRIAMPRLDTPRMRVAAGSVGIAGEQTGIYPCDTPGGWRIIGRTSVHLYDATRAEPFLLKAGDHVQFVSA
ncbi:MAG: 5-oxoprolinase subunit PxpB [Vicinamibacterales bacterium]